MSNTLGVMITCTTYGAWLRGDQRGWVEDGKILPADPQREADDRARMTHAPWTFSPPQCLAAGALICRSLRTRLDVPLWALAVESWHVHAVVDPRPHDVGRVVKCIKDAVRYGLKPGRPIWSAGYDKRWCFHLEALAGRIHYVERHNTRHGFAAQRWDGVSGCPHLGG